MSDRDTAEERERTAEILRMAIPFASSDYISRHEFVGALATIEAKITNSELRQRNWVLAGCLAIILTFGGGYMSLVSKLDRLGEAMPAVDRILDGRRSWMLRKDQIDGLQDRAIKSVLPNYEPPPYVEPPR